MNRKLVAGVVGAALVAFLIWFFGFRGGGDDPATGAAGGGSSAAGGFKDSRGRTPGGTAPGEARSATIPWDEDPVGGLQLEGQVLDDHDDPVKGAEVSLSSTPPRKTVTADDGSFTFDRLVSRKYSVNARAGDLVGGPVMQQLTSKSPPVVIRLRRGATLAVHVVTETDATPVAGAAVQLRESIEQTATTGADGVATFPGVSAGWAQVVATAPGYAPADAATLVGTSATTVELTVLMRHGAAVSGRVVDEAGQPVANAYVLRQNAGRWWQAARLDKDAVQTSATGEFTFPVVPAGSFRFVARHTTLAPASSEPVTVDGTHAQKGVEIVMKAGGVVAGVVVDTTKKPVPNATITVAPKNVNEYQNGGGVRQVVADTKGEFTIRGLPRSNLRVRAESDTAASAIQDLDLTTKLESPRLELVLDVTGMISGVVVDSTNQPVAEAQVSAVKDIWAGDTADIGMTGFASATTDGGGAFAIHGLADGEYQVSVHRSGIGADAGWGKKGVAAKTGDTNVRLVLPSPGSIKGELVLAAGGTPKLAIVAVSWDKSVPAIDGRFQLDDVAPGTYDLTVRGPEFLERTVRDVVVTEGKTTDAGTLKLERGRRVTGLVVDGEGAPVAGARVRVGKLLVTEGGSAGAADPNLEQMMGQRSATTGADGRFTIVGINKTGNSILAEHADRGRSDAVKLAPGQDDPPEVRLQLRGFGSIAGTVTAKGVPLKAVVMATPKQGGGQIVSVESGPDGNYVIDKVGEGTHRLTATKMGMMSMASSEGTDVVVVAGQRATANLEIPSGDLTVSIAIKPKQGATVNAAQVFLFRGVYAATNVKDMMDSFTGGGAAPGGMKFWMGAGDVVFEETLPGRVTICSIPITGDMRDPQLQQRIQEHSDALAVYCMGLDLPASPKQQTYPQSLPAMNPLPAE